jgi:cytochrome P450
VLNDDVLPDGTRVKKGDQVSYVPYCMGRMEFLWGADALIFNPDRWLNEEGRFQPQSPYKFSAFQVKSPIFDA